MEKRMDVLQFLNSAQAYREEAFRHNRIAEELEARCHRLTPPAPSMPKGNGGADQNELLAVYADARTKELRAAREAEEKRFQVELFIDRIEEPVYREILHLRYISRFKWEKVCSELQRAGFYYSDRHIARLHIKALEEARELWAEITEDSP